jgi:hypothetical protein
MAAMIRLGGFADPTGAGPPGLISEISFPAKFDPEFSLGLYATITFVNGSKATDRKPNSGAFGGFGLHPLQLPAVNVNVVKLWSSVLINPICGCGELAL